MGKFALIINGLVHTIEDIPAADIDELYSKYRSKELAYVDITNNTQGIAEGWTYDGANFIAPPIPASTTEQQIAELNAQYLPQFQSLQRSYIAAQISGNEAGQASIQQTYQALQAQYNQAMEGIINGN